MATEVNFRQKKSNSRQRNQIQDPSINHIQILRLEINKSQIEPNEQKSTKEKKNTNLINNKKQQKIHY